jgi:hypothetical protein
VLKKLYNLFTKSYAEFIVELKYDLKSSKIDENDVNELIMLIRDDADINFIIKNNLVSISKLLENKEINSKIINCLIEEQNLLNSTHVDILVDKILNDRNVLNGLNKNSILFFHQLNNDKLVGILK